MKSVTFSNHTLGLSHGTFGVTVQANQNMPGTIIPPTVIGCVTVVAEVNLVVNDDANGSSKDPADNG